MKKIVLALVLVLSLGATQAQTVSKATVDQYHQLIKLNQQSYEICDEQLAKWGFTHNKSGIVDVFTMQMHPYFRQEGQDTVGAMLGVIDGVVYSQSGIFSSKEPERTFSLISWASAIQQQYATSMGLTKFLCSVKGKVSNKFPKSQEELVKVLNGATADDVKIVYVTWKSADGKVTLSLVYENKRHGKKKTRATDRAEITLGYSTVPERQ